MAGGFVGAGGSSTTVGLDLYEGVQQPLESYEVAADHQPLPELTEGAFGDHHCFEGGGIGPDGHVLMGWLASLDDEFATADTECEEIHGNGGVQAVQLRGIEMTLQGEHHRVDAQGNHRAPAR